MLVAMQGLRLGIAKMPLYATTGGYTSVTCCTVGTLKKARQVEQKGAVQELQAECNLMYVLTIHDSSAAHHTSRLWCGSGAF